MSNGTTFDIEDFGVKLSAGITCPKHDWSFDLHTGKSDRGSYKLAIWETQLRKSDSGEDEVWARRKQRIGCTAFGAASSRGYLQIARAASHHNAVWEPMGYSCWGQRVVSEQQPEDSAVAREHLHFTSAFVDGKSEVVITFTLEA